MNVGEFFPSKVGELLFHVRDALRRAIDEFGAEAEWKDVEGIYFCLAEGATGTPFALVLVGDAIPERKEKFSRLALENARRLSTYPSHRTSFESRDKEEGRYSGAVRIGTLIFSVSGLPEAGDEAVALLSAYLAADLLTKEDAKGSAMIREEVEASGADHPNCYWNHLLRALHQSA